jgi:peptidoglycan hydrolase CwlO-like protein
MMHYLKTLLFITIIIWSVATANAQANISSTKIDNQNRNAAMVQIDQTVEVTSNALEQRMKRAGLSGKTQNGFTVYKGVTLSEINVPKIDIYTKVEKGPSANTSIVYMAVSKGYDNFISPESDSNTMEQVKNFLNSLVKDANMYSVDLQISSHSQAMKKDEQDYQELLNDKSNLEKKKTELEKSITELENQIKEKKAEIDRRKEVLEEVKEKKNSE